MTLDLLPGAMRGYWKHHTPSKWFKQAKTEGKINNEKANLLLDSGAEVSILGAAFARKVGCYVDKSQRQECVGIGEGVYITKGRPKIKITLAGAMVYFFDVWVGERSGQDAILGMDFMVPAGIRLDFADGTLCLPDETTTIVTIEEDNPIEESTEPMVAHPQYDTPTGIPRRPIGRATGSSQITEAPEVRRVEVIVGKVSGTQTARTYVPEDQIDGPTATDG
ncbi:hypothetical protein PInf_017686 [Phytophthora infestans]|nr:hypothetical protein PInf_017686 [Phytophthora infestans]